MAKKNKSKPQPQTHTAPIAEQKRRPFVPVMGAAYSFTPAAFLQERTATLPGQKPVPREVTGKITYINWAHHWFRVTYKVNGTELSQGIKF